MYCDDVRRHVGVPELGLVDRERDHVQPLGLEASVGRGRLHHQQPLDVAERIRLRQVPQRVGGLGLDPRRVGVRDPDEHLVRALGGAAQVLEVAVVERLEPPVDHPRGARAQPTTTPEPSSTRPTRRMKSFRDSNSASSAGAALGRDRDEQAARGLRVVAERDERLRHVAVRASTCRRGEVAVARVAARAHALARQRRARRRSPGSAPTRAGCARRCGRRPRARARRGRSRSRR